MVANFPFVGIGALENHYSIFKVEPMHMFSLGIIKLFKECLIEMLGDPIRKLIALRTFQMRCKLHGQIKRTKLCWMITFSLNGKEIGWVWLMPGHIEKKKGLFQNESLSRK